MKREGYPIAQGLPGQLAKLLVSVVFRCLNKAITQSTFKACRRCLQNLEPLGSEDTIMSGSSHYIAMFDQACIAKPSDRGGKESSLIRTGIKVIYFIQARRLDVLLHIGTKEITRNREGLVQLTKKPTDQIIEPFNVGSHGRS